MDGVGPYIGRSLFPLDIGFTFRWDAEQSDILFHNLVSLTGFAFGMALQGDADVLGVLAVNQLTFAVVLPALRTDQAHIPRVLVGIGGAHLYGAAG